MANKGDYNVYIIDPFNKVPITAVASTLRDWFDPIAQKAGYARAYVCSAQYVVHAAPHELLIYVCPHGTSVVQKMPGVDKSKMPHPLTSQHLGYTGIRGAGGVNGSEIWAKFSDADAFASLIFHEAMHNKLQADNTMHSRFKNPNVSGANITWGTPPSAEESAAMAAALGNPVRQWTDGQQILRSAAGRLWGQDPMWDADITF